MKHRQRTPSPVAFYEEQVLPAVFAQLDKVFAELKPKRTTRGWTATNREETKARFGARADRVVCNRPGGFLVHGGGSVSWLAYLKGGTATPTGVDFVDAVKDLAQLAGVDTSPLERELSPEEEAAFHARQRRGDLMEDFVSLTHEALLGDRGEAAREYLVARGFTLAQLEDLPLGFYAGVEPVSAAMKAKGYSAQELEDAGLLADSRWTGRLLIPWRDAVGRVATVAARDTTGTAEEGAKYLYLKGGTKPPAFGLDVAKASASARREGLVLVEGLLDVVLLHARGMEKVAALGGAGNLLTAERWGALGRLDFPALILAMDSDAAGREGTLKALSHLSSVSNVRKVYVLAPDALRGHKDPDELVRAEGVEAFRDALREALPWALYYGDHLLAGVTPEGPEREKRDAANRVLDFSANLRGERASLDAEDLLKLASERTGYTYETLRALDTTARERVARERAEAEVKGLTGRIQDELAKPGADVYHLASEYASRLAGVRGMGEEPPPVFSVDAMLAELKTTREGLRTGLQSVDELGVRFTPKELALLGARPGHCKTTFLVHLCRTWLDETLAGPVVFFSHEEPPELVFARLVSLLTATTRSPWPIGEVREYERAPSSRSRWPDPKTRAAALDRLRELEPRLHIVHRPQWTVSRIAAHAHELAATRGVGAILVDYVQRIPAEGEGQRYHEVGLIGRGLKALAVDLAVPVVAGAQINRTAIPTDYAKNIQENLAKGVDKTLEYMAKSARPDLHNLREGGEQEADVVLGLMNYAADMKTDEGDGNATDRFDVGVLKNRYGPTAKWARLVFEAERGRIREKGGF